MPCASFSMLASESESNNTIYYSARSRWIKHQQVAMFTKMELILIFISGSPQTYERNWRFIQSVGIQFKNIHRKNLE